MDTSETSTFVFNSLMFTLFFAVPPVVSLFELPALLVYQYSPSYQEFIISAQPGLIYSLSSALNQSAPIQLVFVIQLERSPSHIRTNEVNLVQTTTLQ